MSESEEWKSVSSPATPVCDSSDALLAAVVEANVKELKVPQSTADKSLVSTTVGVPEIEGYVITQDVSPLEVTEPCCVRMTLTLCVLVTAMILVVIVASSPLRANFGEVKVTFRHRVGQGNYSIWIYL